MRKQDGYILVFVLVVMFAVEVFALAITSSVIRAHTRQARSVAEMQERYTLTGELQKLEGTAQHTTYSWDDPTADLQDSISSYLEGIGFGTGMAASKIEMERTEQTAPDADETVSTSEVLASVSFDDMKTVLSNTTVKNVRLFLYTPTYSAVHNANEIEADIKITMAVSLSGAAGSEIITLTPQEVSYGSYSITEVAS